MEFDRIQDVLRARLRRVMEEGEIKQKELAEACGISVPKVSQTLNGRLPVTVEMVYVLRHVYNVDLEAFLSGPEQEPTDLWLRTKTEVVDWKTLERELEQLQQRMAVAIEIARGAKRYQKKIG